MDGTSKRLMDSASKMIETYDETGGVNRIDGKNLPTLKAVVEILDDLMQILFPGYFGSRVPARSNVLFFIQSAVDSIYLRLTDLVTRALQSECKLEDCQKSMCEQMAEDYALRFIDRLPEIRSRLKLDIRAGFEGDPAAKSTEEVILCYPFVYAISVHRIAHVLYNLEIPLIPRIMSEWAHRRTGVDIHPGAHIGERFFIDHGTGVVIGETTEIGNDVKIYQGVTLGALSFPKNPDGSIVKGGKRHPTIQDRVTVYAGATILGGETVIGEDSVIGANSWITASVPRRTLVTFQEQQSFRSLDRSPEPESSKPAIDFQI